MALRARDGGTTAEGSATGDSEEMVGQMRRPNEEWIDFLRRATREAEKEALRECGAAEADDGEGTPKGRFSADSLATDISGCFQ